jgi:PAS domain S-box-containing protein
MEAPVLKYFPVPSFLISKKSSEIIQLNDKAADLTGLEVGSLSGIKITNFLKTKFLKPGEYSNIDFRLNDRKTLSVHLVVQSLTENRQNYLIVSFWEEPNNELEKARQAIIESEELYRKLFNSSKDAIMTLEPPSWKFTSGNLAIFELFKVKNLRDFLSLKPWEISPKKQPDGSVSIEKAKEMIQLAMNHGSHYFEWVHQRKNGEPFYATVLLTRVDLANRSFLQATVCDVSEQKKSEERLRESELKYRTLVEASKDSIFIIQDGLIKFVNSELKKLSGYTTEEIVGKPFADFIAPKDAGKVKSYYQKRNSGKEVPSKYELVVRIKSGKFIPVEISVAFIDFLGKHSEMVVIKNVTERRKREAIQRVLFEITRISFHDIGLKEYLAKIHVLFSQLISAENFYIALYDKVSDQYTFPYFVDEFDHFESDQMLSLEGTLTDFVRKTGKGRLITEETEKQLFTESGFKLVGEYSPVWVGAPLVDSSTNEVIGVIVVQDYKNKDAYSPDDLLTLEIVASSIGLFIERVRSNQDLKLAKEKAIESDRLKSAFLANMSHEIRTPMNGILGFAELLKEPRLTGEEQQEYIDIIEKSGHRMLNIINDIISISKVESGLMEVNISATNVNEQMKYIYTFFRPETEKKGVRLLLNNDLSDKEAIIQTDREKLYAILTNLVKNAIKFTTKGTIELGCKIVPMIHESSVQFYIKDTGTGIHHDKQTIVFERFRQGSESLDRNYEGAGLGLSISKAYVELLGGKLWVESQENVGSTFFFTIPYLVKALGQTGSRKLQVTGLPAVKVKKLKILIAEDDLTSEVFITLVLKSMTKELIIARTGTEAVNACQHHPDIDLVIMDIKIPEMDGYEATRQIRQFNKEIIIIAQTAYALVGDGEKAIAAGCNDYIAKPINRDHLTNMIKNHFKN